MNWYSNIKKVASEEVAEEDLGIVRDFAGLRVQVENSAGTERIGLRPDGSEWRTKMKYDYGFLSSTKGSDGEGIDVYLGPDFEADNAYVVHQVDPESGKYDEDKVMLGFRDEDDAKMNYLAHYDSPEFFGSMTTIPFDEFKDIIDGSGSDKIDFKKKSSLISSFIKISQAEFLQQLGVDSQVIDYVSTLDSQSRGFVVNEIRKNPSMTFEQVQSIIAPNAMRYNEPTIFEHEIAEPFAMASTNYKFYNWITSQLIKLRMTNPSPNFGPNEDIHFDYKPEGILFIRKINEINDWVNQNNIDVTSITAIEATERSDQWHAQLAEGGDGENYLEGEENIIYGPKWKNEKWDGWTIRKVTTSNDLKAEGEQMGNCFTPEAEIRTKKGFFPISEINKGDYVLTETGKYKEVVKVFSREYKGNIIKFQTRLGNDFIKVTPNHEFLTLMPLHGDTKPCRLHTCGSLCRNNIPENKHCIKWEKIEDSCKNSYFLSRVPKEFYDISSIEVPVKHIIKKQKGSTTFCVDKDFLWIIGMYIAEGCNDGDKLSFSLHKKETDYADRIIKFFYNHGFSPRMRKEKDSYNGMVVLVNSRMLSRWFDEWIGHGCSNKKIPYELLNLPNNKIEYVWDGIFSGDGCSGQNVLNQTSPDLALQSIEIGIRLKGTPSLSISDNYNRKRKTSYVIENADSKLDKNKSRKRNFWRHHEELLVKPILYKTEYYSGKVYNLEVKSVHSYVVQHLVAHNCIGGYCGDIAVNKTTGKANTDVYSLRDPSNKPFVSMAAESGTYNFFEIGGNARVSGSQEIRDEHKPAMSEWFLYLQENGNEVIIEGDEGYDYSELKNEYGRNVDSELHDIIFKGGEYGIENNIVNWDFDYAYESVVELVNFDRDDSMRSEGYGIAQTLAQAILESDMKNLSNDESYKANTIDEIAKVLIKDRDTRWYPDEDKISSKKGLAQLYRKQESDKIELDLKHKERAREKVEINEKMLEYAKNTAERQMASLESKTDDQLIAEKAWIYFSESLNSSRLQKQIEKDEEGDATDYINDEIYETLKHEGITDPDLQEYETNEEYNTAMQSFEVRRDEIADEIYKDRMPFTFNHAIVKEVSKQSSSGEYPKIEKKEWMPYELDLQWMQSNGFRERQEEVLKRKISYKNNWYNSTKQSVNMSGQKPYQQPQQQQTTEQVNKYSSNRFCQQKNWYENKDLNLNEHLKRLFEYGFPKSKDWPENDREIYLLELEFGGYGARSDNTYDVFEEQKTVNPPIKNKYASYMFMCNNRVYKFEFYVKTKNELETGIEGVVKRIYDGEIRRPSMKVLLNLREDNPFDTLNALSSVILADRDGGNNEEEAREPEPDTYIDVPTGDLQYAKKKLPTLKIAQISGEWWITPQGVVFADGNVGDYNHEGYVIDSVMRTITDEASNANMVSGYYSDNDHVDWDSFYEELAKYAGNKYGPIEDPYEALENNLNAILQEMGTDAGDWEIVNGGGDARAYAQEKWGWKRLEGTRVETFNITSRDMDMISNGLFEAHGYDSQKSKYSIYVDSNKAYFEDIPFKVIENGNPSSLREFKFVGY